MLKITDQPFRIQMQLPQIGASIATSQNAACKSTSWIFARMVQCIKDLFNRIFSCVQRPKQLSITNLPIVREQIILPKPKMQNEVDAPVVNNPEPLRPPVLPEPRRLLVGEQINLMDIDAINNYLRAIEIARRYENVLRLPVPDALIRWYHYDPRHVETTLAALREYKEVLETMLDDEDFLHRVDAMELAEVETRMRRLENADPRREALLERGFRLRSIVLPQQIIHALPRWDLNRLSQEIVTYSERRTLLNQRLLQLNGEERAREQAELDLVRMILRHLRERFNEINPPPDLDEYPLEPIAAQPVAAPVPPVLPEPERLRVRLNHPDDIQLMDVDAVDEYLVGLQGIWHFVNVLHMQLNPDWQAHYNYDPETVDATLAALRERKAALESIMHDANFMPEWEEMQRPEIDDRMQRCQGVIYRVLLQLRNLQGEAPIQVRRELDLAYAEKHLLQERLRMINMREMPVERLPQALPEDLRNVEEIIDLDEVDRNIAQLNAWQEEAVGGGEEFADRVAIAYPREEALRARRDELLLRHLPEDLNDVIYTVNLETVQGLANALIEPLAAVRSEFEEQNQLPPDQRDEELLARFRRRFEITNARFLNFQARMLQLRSTPIPPNILEALRGMNQFQLLAEMERYQQVAQQNFRGLVGEARRTAQVEQDTAFAILREIDRRIREQQ